MDKSRTLNEIFDEAYKLFESFDKRDDPTNSPEFQVRWSKDRRSCIYMRKIKKMRNVLIDFMKIRNLFSLLGIGEKMHWNVRRLNAAGQHEWNVQQE